MRELMINRAEEGQRLDRFLGKYLPGAASGFLHKMLRKKNIKLNGGRAEGNEKIKEGDRIQIYFSEETLEKFTAQNRPEKKTLRPLTKQQKELREKVRLLAKTEDVLIFHKPAGMLTQKAKKEDDSLNDYLLDYCLKEGILKASNSFRPSVANRLDRNTSGIVLCGITVRGLQLLSRLLKERNVEKYYLCLVWGEMSGDRHLKGWLCKNQRTNQVTLSPHQTAGAALVETWYEVLEAGEGISLLKVRLITGKSHQIRAHLSSVGHPILGDIKYGDPKVNQIFRKEGIRYQMLHSAQIHFPKKGEEIPKELKGRKIVDPAPEEFERILRKKGFKNIGT